MGVVNGDLTLSFDPFDKYSFEIMHNLEKASDTVWDRITNDTSCCLVDTLSHIQSPARVQRFSQVPVKSLSVIMNGSSLILRRPSRSRSFRFSGEGERDRERPRTSENQAMAEADSWLSLKISKKRHFFSSRLRHMLRSTLFKISVCVDRRYCLKRYIRSITIQWNLY